MKNNQKDQLIGLVINGGEKDNLHKICLQYQIPILYEDSFTDNTEYHLWAFNDDGIGLIGTYIMRRLPIILHGVKEFERYLCISRG